MPHSVWPGSTWCVWTEIDDDVRRRRRWRSRVRRGGRNGRCGCGQRGRRRGRRISERRLGARGDFRVRRVDLVGAHLVGAGRHAVDDGQRPVAVGSGLCVAHIDAAEIEAHRRVRRRRPPGDQTAAEARFDRLDCDLAGRRGCGGKGEGGRRRRSGGRRRRSGFRRRFWRRHGHIYDVRGLRQGSRARGKGQTMLAGRQRRRDDDELALRIGGRFGDGPASVLEFDRGVRRCAPGDNRLPCRFDADNVERRCLRGGWDGRRRGRRLCRGRRGEGGRIGGLPGDHDRSRVRPDEARMGQVNRACPYDCDRGPRGACPNCCCLRWHARSLSAARYSPQTYRRQCDVMPLSRALPCISAFFRPGTVVVRFRPWRRHSRGSPPVRPEAF